ncbi:MAG: RNA-binding protein [Alphaproteobacteria bacterium]|nr:RNA-binding protein [Alphaproteobacteria bacterium]
MPKGPKGEKRPADVIGAAVMVMKIATDEIQDVKRDPGKEYARKGGLKGGKARAKVLDPERRQQIARNAAKVRWKGGS